MSQIGVFLGRDEPSRLFRLQQGVTTSVGAALFLRNGGDMRTLLNNADKAMYRAKRTGALRLSVLQPEHGGPDRDMPATAS